MEGLRSNAASSSRIWHVQATPWHERAPCAGPRKRRLSVAEGFDGRRSLLYTAIDDGPGVSRHVQGELFHGEKSSSHTHILPCRQVENSAQPH